MEHIHMVWKLRCPIHIEAVESVAVESHGSPSCQLALFWSAHTCLQGILWSHGAPTFPDCSSTRSLTHSAASIPYLSFPVPAAISSSFAWFAEVGSGLVRLAWSFVHSHDLWWSPSECQVSLELSLAQRDRLLGHGRWSLLQRSRSCAFGEREWLSGIGHYCRMHWTIRNGSIGTASYRMAMIMSCWLTMGVMVGVGSEGLVADISPRKTFQ